MLFTKKNGLFEKLQNGLNKIRKVLSDDLDIIFNDKKYFDDNMLEKIEELLITSDMGVDTTFDLMKKISKKKRIISNSEDLRQVMQKEIVSYFDDFSWKFKNTPCKPSVIMVVGVNGVGKTITIAKLAARESKIGNKVMIAASDTFRAAAVEQISLYAEKIGSSVVKSSRHNADPAAVAYDGVAAAVARGYDTVFVDTAGRLHTNVNLMNELKKIKRSISKKIFEAPHEILLVVDATTGQNAIAQASMFNELLGITGIVLTKLDGTAKGGVVVNIYRSLGIPIKFVGIGENVNDLCEFDPEQFISAMF